MDIASIQHALLQANVDGWLLYDFRRSNDIACRFLGISSDTLLTRRLLYWIPQTGEPRKIVHAIEPHHLDHLPGEILLYRSWQQLEARVATALKGSATVAMEYSPRNALPYVSKVDAGTVDFVRDQGVEVVSSADLLQRFMGIWDKEKVRLHKEAAYVVDAAVEKAWLWIELELQSGRAPTDYGVQQFIMQIFAQENCVTNAPPICAINADSADPHYSAIQAHQKPIKAGDFLLIDLWCKRNLPKATYADICRVGVIAPEPTPKQREIFSIVKAAQEAATHLVRDRMAKGDELMGWEVDQAARDVITQAGYGQCFIHRTGHNIDENDHGDGTHMDNFETHDTRHVRSGTCFSIEPGIYLPGEFGVRLEYDVLVHYNGEVEVTGGSQSHIRCISLRL